MELEIKPADSFQADLEVPGDKSISHRSLILAGIAPGKSTINNLLEADDCLKTLNILKELGVRIERRSPGKYEVKGEGLDGLAEPKDVLDCGNSGTTMRLMTGLLAGLNFYSVLSGDRSLRSRPMNRVADPLRSMGADIWTRDGGLAPLSVKGGGLSGIDFEQSIASAQVKSCLLLAGLSADGKTKIREPAPSRDHTERMLSAAGVDVEVNGGVITLPEGDHRISPLEIEVPGDISSAAFILGAGLIIPGSKVTVKKTGINPTRSGFLDVLKRMNADIDINNEREIGGEVVADIHVSADSLQAVKIEGDIIPRMLDEIPILAVLAARAQGKTVISDAEELRVKETDRLSAMADSLNKMGADIKEKDDGLIINGPTPLRGDVVLDSYHDHRIAMALAVAGLTADSSIRITRSEVIANSFPQFIDILKNKIMEVE